MHYSRHSLTASVATWLRACTRQPVSNGLALLAHWSLCNAVYGRVASLIQCTVCTMQVLHGIQLDYTVCHVLIMTSQRIITFDYLVICKHCFAILGGTSDNVCYRLYVCLSVRFTR